MIVAVFRRRLKNGKSFEDFKQAWEAEKGFGVPTRVFSAVSLTDEREVLTIGFVATEHDFSGDPREIEVGSPDSLLCHLKATPGPYR